MRVLIEYLSEIHLKWKMESSTQLLPNCQFSIVCTIKEPNTVDSKEGTRITSASVNTVQPNGFHTYGKQKLSLGHISKQYWVYKTTFPHVTIMDKEILQDTRYDKKHQHILMVRVG